MTRENTNKRYSEQIDENLKRVYQEIVDEQVPDRFQQLLAQLKEQDAKSASDKDQGSDS